MVLKDGKKYNIAKTAIARELACFIWGMMTDNYTKYFIKYIKEKHPECTTLKSAKKYANEWLQTRVDQGLSAWTVQLEAKALGKLYGISPDDENYFKPPKRKREEIKRSRGDRVRDKHFSKTNNDELIKFCRGTGLRRKELQELRGKDLVPRAQIEAEISELQKIPEEQRAPSVTKRLEMLQDARLFPEEWFIHVRKGKGGRERLSPIIGKNAGPIIERITDTPPEEKGHKIIVGIQIAVDERHTAGGTGHYIQPPIGVGIFIGFHFVAMVSFRVL